MTSPCVGLLVNREEAKEAIRCKTITLPQQLEHESLLLRQWQLDTVSWEEAVGIEQRRADGLAKLLDEADDPPPFYSTWWFGAIVGVVGGVALTWAISEVDR